jgi:hypothetical protein
MADSPHTDGESEGRSAAFSPPSLPPPNAPQPIALPPVEQPPNPAAAPDSPFLPAAKRIDPVEQEPPPAFDAKAMVESQKRVNENPTYGALPTGTEEGRARAEALRTQARRKRHRQKIIGRIAIAVLLCGLAVGAWFAYHEYQSDQDRLGATNDPAPAAGEPIRNDNLG